MGRCSKGRSTYPLLLFYALWDHGSVLAVQQLHKDIVLPSSLQLCSVDDLQTCKQASALGDAVQINVQPLPVYAFSLLTSFRH